MVSITLPDGSQKQFENAPHRAGCRRLDRRGSGQGRARGQGRRQAGRYEFPDRSRRQDRNRHREKSRRARHHPPLDGASARAGDAASVSGYAGDDRSGHRKRFLLRLRAQDAVHAGRSGQDRSGDEEDRRGERAGAAQRHGRKTTRSSSSRTRARTTRPRSSTTSSRRARKSRCTGRATGSICAAVRTCRTRASSRRSS